MRKIPPVTLQAFVETFIRGGNQEKNMQKKFVRNTMTSLILACFLFLPMSTQLASYEQICPLSRYNIKVAEDLWMNLLKIA
jgi:hypothetical protein